MKKIVTSSLVVTTQLLIGGLFLVVLFSSSIENNKKVVINSDLNRMADASLNVVEVSENTDNNNIEEKISEIEAVEDSIEPVSDVVVATTQSSHINDVALTSYNDMVLTGYGYDCYGCTSGLTSTGHDAHNIYYDDVEYGTVRVVAADKSIPFCSIVRISNVDGMDPILAIVLDRGGNVGFGLGTFMDLLYPSEGEAIHKTTGVNIDILKYGDNTSCLE